MDYKTCSMLVITKTPDIIQSKQGLLEKRKFNITIWLEKNMIFCEILQKYKKQNFQTYIELSQKEIDTPTTPPCHTAT